MYYQKGSGMVDKKSKNLELLVLLYFSFCFFGSLKYAKIKSRLLICTQLSVGFLKMVGPKKQDFWLKINKLKGNHCILRIRGAPVCQKLSMILENKVV